MYVSMPIVQHTCSTNLGTWVIWVTHLCTCLDDSKCAHKGRGMHLYQPSKVSSRSVLLSSPPIHSSIPAFINNSRYQLPTDMHARYLTYLSIHPFVSASLCPSILYIRLIIHLTVRTALLPCSMHASFPPFHHLPYFLLCSFLLSFPFITLIYCVHLRVFLTNFFHIFLAKLWLKLCQPI